MHYQAKFHMTAQFEFKLSGVCEVNTKSQEFIDETATAGNQQNTFSWITSIRIKQCIFPLDLQKKLA